MTEENKYLDPSALGFLTVAAVSLPLAAVMFDDEAPQTLEFFVAAGILLIIVGLLAWKCNANFGFTVFSLVGLGVLLSGNGQIGGWGDITFGLIYAFAIAWSALAGNGKNLTLLLVTTALIFLILGIDSVGEMDGDLNVLVGIVAIFNFLLNFYMGMSCAFPEKFKPF